jgi:hypothetical protein
MCEVSLELNNVPGAMCVCGGGEQQPFPGPVDETHPLEERTEGCGVARHETRLAQPGCLGLPLC